MNTSSFLATLRGNSGLPLVFRSGSVAVAAGYHLTEVKEVSYRTMDCGAMTHRWSENQFELWVPASAREEESRGYMDAGKFLRIVDRVEQEIPLDGEAEARIFVSLGDAPASLYTIDQIDAGSGRLTVSLSPDRARCKARERSEATAGSEARAGGCGCGSPSREAAVCCA